MIGCSKGINSIEVKAPNGAPSTLFPKLVARLGVDNAYKAYLRSEMPKVRQQYDLSLDSNGEVDFAEFMSIANNLDMSFNSKGPTESKPGTEKMTTAILERAELIMSPEEDAEGNQADTYSILDTSGAIVDTVRRVSGMIGDFIYTRKSKFESDEKLPLVEKIIESKVSHLFNGVEENGTTHYRGKDYTREEFADSLRRSYKQGAIKGNIIHALLELKFSNYPADSVKYKEIMEKIRINKEKSLRDNPDEYDWVLKKDIFDAIVDNLKLSINSNTRKVPSEFADTISAEVKVYNEILGVGGSIDTLVESHTGHLRVIDTKTGNNFDKRSLGSRIMKYGNQTSELYDDSLGRAKLQTVLYSMMLKLNHPEAKILPPKILHLPSEAAARNPSTVKEVEVRDYLAMIETFLKTEEPAKYKKLIEASPEVFNPMSYGVGRNTDAEELFMNSENPKEDLRRLELELETLQATVNLRVAEQGGVAGDWTAKEKARRVTLMRQILQARSWGIRLPDSLESQRDMSRFSKWVGTLGSSHNAFVQAYAQTVEQARHEIRKEKMEIFNEFDAKLTAVMKERGVNVNSATFKNFRTQNSREVYRKFLVNRESTDGEGNIVVEREMVTEEDPEWKSLTAAEKDFISFIQTTMGDTFQKVMVNGENSVIGAYNGKPLTKLDLYNRENSFKWSKGFIPKVSILREEVLFDVKSGKRSKGSAAKDWLARNYSMYYEEHVDGAFTESKYGLPVRFLGSGRFSHNPDIHSENLEHVFKTFMGHYINKKHYDTVYSLGESVKQYMRTSDHNGNPILKETAEFLESHIERNLQGRIVDRDDKYVRIGLNLANLDGKAVSFSGIKFLRWVAGNAAAAALWLNPIGATKNATQAFWAVSKHGWTSALADKIWPGIEIQDTGANVWKLNKELVKMQQNMIKGQGASDPIHVFMDTFQLYPDVSEFNHGKGYLTGMGRFYNLGAAATSLYSYPEEWSAAQLAINTMMSMIIKEGPYKGKSMWEVYKSSVKVDPVTKKGYFELPEDFTRGKIRDGQGQLRDWKGLEPIEVQKIKRVIQTVKGGYRQEERTLLESTALGEVFMMFKRWLPATLTESFQSKREDASLGFFEKREGEDYYEWKSRVVEGRFRTLGGLILEYSGISKGRGYRGGQLNEWQKKNLSDLAITCAAGVAAMVFYFSVMADREEEDSLRKFTFEASMKLIEQWNVVDMAKTATGTPMAVKSSLEFLTGLMKVSKASVDYMVGNEEDAFTRRGDIQGMNQILKNVPFTSWYYSGNRFIEGLQD